MRALSAVLLASVGCSFVGGPGSGVDARVAPDGSPLADAAADGAVDAAQLTLCGDENPLLGGCWEFENNLLDSTANDNDGTAFNDPMFAAGFAGNALDITGNDAVLIGESLSLDSSAITVEARINVDDYPAPTQEGVIFDNQSQYALLIVDDDGKLGCVAASGPPITSLSGLVPLDAWVHVGCVVDSTRIRMFFDGDEIMCATRVNPVQTGGDVGSAMGTDLNAGGTPTGGFFDGLIDSLRVFEGARTAAEMCAAAGKSGCTELDVTQCT